MGGFYFSLAIDQPNMVESLTNIVSLAKQLCNIEVTSDDIKDLLDLHIRTDACRSDIIGNTERATETNTACCKLIPKKCVAKIISEVKIVEYDKSWQNYCCLTVVSRNVWKQK